MVNPFAPTSAGRLIVTIYFMIVLGQEGTIDRELSGDGVAAAVPAARPKSDISIQSDNLLDALYRYQGQNRMRCR